MAAKRKKKDSSVPQPDRDEILIHPLTISRLFPRIDDEHLTQSIPFFNDDYQPIVRLAEFVNDDPELRQLTQVSSINKPPPSDKKKPQDTPQKDARLFVQTILYTTQIPEYPRTEPEGFMYVILTNGLSEDEIKNPWDDIQYNHGRVFPSKTTTSAFLGGSACLRSTYRCTGVKCCQHLPSEPLWDHQEVTSEIWQRLQTLREASEPASMRTKAILWAEAVLKRFRTRIACREVTASCALVTEYTNYGAVAGHPQLVVQCVNRSEQPEQYRNQHHLSYPNPEFKDFYSLISDILRGKSDFVSKDVCGFTSSNRRKIATCDTDHSEGLGNLKQLECEVRWNFFIPIDRQVHPYMLLTSHGIHTHPPPPISQIPMKYIRDISRIVNTIGPRNLGMNAFWASREVQDLVTEYGGKSLHDLHPSLVNTDRIRALIRKQAILHHPEGSSRLAVLVEYERKLNDPDRYIQFFEDNGQNYIAICFYKEQTQLFTQKHLVSFEVDTNYKSLESRKEVEVVWGWFSPVTKVSIPIVRIFTNCDTPEMYMFMFEKVFDLMQERYNYRVQWKHLHGTGIIGITIDMDFKLVTGFTHYLKKLDPQNHSWIWQFHRTVRFCKVHFERGIAKALGSDKNTGPDSNHSRMMQLLQVVTEEDYLTLCALIGRNDSLKSWADHKARTLIRSGLNNACSKIRSADWNMMQSHTNIVEILHEASYRWSGRFVSLLSCVRSSATFDRKKLEEDQTYRELGIQLSYRDRTMLGRFSDSMQRQVRDRERKRKAKASNVRTNETLPDPTSSQPPPLQHTQTEPEPEIIEDDGMNANVDDISSLARFSSSGISFSSSSRVKKRRRITATETIHESTQKTTLSQEQDLEIQEKRLVLRQRELDLKERELQLEERMLALEERRKMLSGS